MLPLLIALLALPAVYATTGCPGGIVGPAIGDLCPVGYVFVNAGTDEGCCDDLSTTTCADKVNPSTGVSNCAANAKLCNNSAYYSLMTEQCPKTCGRCGTTCVDKVDPKTGVSSCAANAKLCNNPAYYSLMTEQCPKTCGRCATGK